MIDREKYERLARATGTVSVATALNLPPVREGVCWVDVPSAHVVLAIRPRQDGKLVLWRRDIDASGRRRQGWRLGYLSLDLFDAQCTLMVAEGVEAPTTASRYKYAGKAEHEVRGWRPR